MMNEPEEASNILGSTFVDNLRYYCVKSIVPKFIPLAKLFADLGNAARGADSERESIEFRSRGHLVIWGTLPEALMPKYP